MLRKGLSRSRVLWLGGTLATIAVVSLSILQIHLLGKLRDASAETRVRRAETLAAAIADGVSAYFRERTTESLGLTRDELYDDQAAAARFARTRFPGARELFVVRMHGDQPRILYFDATAQRLVERPNAESMQAIEMILYPWLTAERRRTLRLPRPGRREVPQWRAMTDWNFNLDIIMADRRNRAVLHPVGMLDNFSGAAGLIVDHRYVADVLLPRVIAEAVKRAGSAAEGLRVVVFVAGGRTIFGTRPSPSETPFAETTLRFAMADHFVDVYSSSATAESLAWRGFALNLALLAVIAILAVAGLVLTVRAAKAELALGTMKQEFVSNVTHELRTPLASIRLFAGLIATARPADFEASRTYGAHIEQESERLTAMVERILDLSRIESRRRQAAFTDVDLVDVIRAALHMHEMRLSDEGFAVTVRNSSGRVAVRGDREALVIAVSNLIDNAVNYSNGVREIDVELSAGDVAQIVVRDRGIGVAAGDAPHVFDRFYRAKADRVREVKGAGLGLAMVKTTIDAHGGSIALFSRGAGSTFVIRLPLTDSPAMEEAG